MKKSTHPYKYSCRDCRIRRRCIEDKSLGPGIKRALLETFASRTDTLETWEILQQDCLLLREDRQAAAQAYRESRLLRRLRQSQKSSQPSRTESPTTRKASTSVRRPGQSPGLPSETLLCGLTTVSTQRMIRLPDRGDCVLGRFESGISNPPDIDLAFDDGEISSVSRRHALVIGRGGQHWIEDMGSRNGTYVNGRQLALGKSVLLAPGNRLLLGRCRLIYTPLPDWALEPDLSVAHDAVLLITHLGHELPLPQKTHVVMGRADLALGYTPDVDLSVAADSAAFVSRRHARIIERGGWHFLEEMGSAAGTRLNGRPVQLSDGPVLLHPGDQIWLGGCVVAYEWRIL